MFKEVELCIEMAEPPVFRNEWVLQINEMLYDHDQSPRRPNEGANYAILRVATPLREMKPKDYIPQFVSMGPYHHSLLEKDIHSSCGERKISTAETRKAMAAARVSQKLHKRGKSFKTMVELMEHMRPDIEHFYHWPTGTTEGEYSKNFALMMAVDSSFLLDFLISYMSRHHEASSSSSSRPLELDPLQVCIKSDILKLENQIPLFVMEIVFENAKEASIYDGLPEDLNQLLQKTCPELSPFNFEVSHSNNPNAAAVKEQPHLLGYMHAFVSPTLQIQEMEKPKLTALQYLKNFIRDIPLYLFSIFVIPTFFFEQKYEIVLNAEKLAAAGIKFKLLSHVTDNIRFDTDSGTLYLPRINVFEMYTEVLLRNMVAWEFNDVTRGTAVMRYVGLMDSLIQTGEDVRVLRDLRVIQTDTLGDDCIAKMWNHLAQPFSTGHLELAPCSGDLGRGLYNVLWQNSNRTRIKRMLWGLFEYVSSWKFIAPVAGILALVMTAIQTYCNLYQLYHPSAPPPHA